MYSGVIRTAGVDCKLRGTRTLGQTRSGCFRSSRAKYSRVVTRVGLRRQTPSRRSSSPYGAATSQPARGDHRTPTHVQYSGTVATASDAELKGSTSMPNRLGYQRCTAA